MDEEVASDTKADFLESSAGLIPWAFVLEETRLESSIEEDPKTRKKRLQAKLVTSIEHLRIKPLSFFSLVSKGKTEELRDLLNKNLACSTSEAIKNEQEELLTHIHEAYQFLIKTFVSTDEGLEEGIVLDEWSIKLKTMERRKSMKVNQPKPFEPSVRRGSRSSLGSDDNDSLDSRQSRRNSFIQMTGIEQEEMDSNDQMAVDADKVANEVLQAFTKKMSKPQQGRRKSVLDTVDEKPLLTLDQIERLKSLRSAMPAEPKPTPSHDIEKIGKAFKRTGSHKRRSSLRQ